MLIRVPGWAGLYDGSDSFPQPKNRSLTVAARNEAHRCAPSRNRQGAALSRRQVNEHEWSGPGAHAVSFRIRTDGAFARAGPAGGALIMVAPKRFTAKKKAGVKKAEDGGRYFSRAVGKALETLELLQLRQESMTLEEIARQVQLSKPSVFRLLRTLEVAGYVTTGG